MARSALDLDVPFGDIHFDDIHAEPAAAVPHPRKNRARVLKTFRNIRNAASLEIPDLHVTAETSVKGSKHDAERHLSDVLNQLSDKVYFEVSELPDGGSPSDTVILDLDADTVILDLDAEPFTDEDPEKPETTYTVEFPGLLRGSGPPLTVRFTIDPLIRGAKQDWKIKNTKRVEATVRAATGKVKLEVGITRRNGHFIGHPRVTTDSSGRGKSRQIGAKSRRKRTFTARVTGLQAYNDYTLLGGWS